MATALTRREALAALSAGVVAPAVLSSGSTEAAEPDIITVVVMDPLAAPLSCPCVKGYAQRDYDKLGKYLEARLGRPVAVHYSETLTNALQKKTGGKADLVIGKDSVVRSEAKRNKVEVSHLLCLSGKDGKTTQTGLVCVAGSDPALTVEGLKGYTVYFGEAAAEEKHGAALELFKDLGVSVPKKLVGQLIRGAG
ncbi:MAG: PhnD/SsuA/transferrin family substrate-binding protein [Gemmataceae bacterium]|nr:PhnD/SsuA/transferrin family substrate-binding protein [Gemmataceae bacterium]